MIVELPNQFEASLRALALSRGLSVEEYVLEVVERDLRLAEVNADSRRPFKSGWGLCADLGPAPSAEEIDENRREMFRGFGER